MEKMTQKEALDMLQQMDVQIVLQNLAYYSQQGDLNKTELLLIAGINPNEIYINEKKNKVYIFQNACIFGNKEIIKLLLKHGANINFQNDNGRTALHEVIEKDKADVVQLLIENGADVNTMTNAKINPLYLAEQKKNSVIIDLLKNAGAREMTQDEIKTHKKNKLVGRVSVGVFLIACVWFGGKFCSGSHSSSNSGGGSSSSSGITHNCLNCSKSYSGYGYSTVGGEEFELTHNSGDQYCSRSCAKSSRTGKFKNM